MTVQIYNGTINERRKSKEDSKNLKHTNSFNRLQSIGLALFSSISKKKKPKHTAPPNKRPISQVLFPTIKEDSEDVFILSASPPANNSTFPITQRQRKQKQTLNYNRHSIAIDYSVSNEKKCSHIKPIKNSNTSSLSRSLSQNISGLSRARTVFGLKSKETKAIDIWNSTISLRTNKQKHKTPIEISTQHNHTMIKFIFNELIETEKSYNQLLKLIRNKYMQPMIKASKCKNPLVKSTDIPILFNHLTDLIELSDKLLRQFQSTMTNQNLGFIFYSLEASLVIFLRYTIHYRTNLKSIKKACNNVLFIKIDQENLSRKDTNRLGISDYFIAPIQRIPRYCLLIKDLIKYIDPLDTITITELNLTLQILTGLAIAMDSVYINNP